MVIWLVKGCTNVVLGRITPQLKTVSRHTKNWGFGFLRLWPKTAVSVPV